jgi:hypothetical protein
VRNLAVFAQHSPKAEILAWYSFRMELRAVFNSLHRLEFKYGNENSLQYRQRTIRRERLEWFGCGQNEPLVQLRNRL